VQRLATGPTSLSTCEKKMRFTSVVVGLLATAASASIIPLKRDYTLHERRDAAPKKWIKRSTVNDAVILPIRIGLTQSNLDKVCIKKAMWM
jgi:tripeptidyl-peptidase-1